MYRRVDNLEFVGYTNSNLNGCPNDRRSTSGYIFMMDEGVISWNSKKQFLVASFTMQAEFITCFSTVTHFFAPHLMQSYPKAHVNPKAFSCISCPIFLESSIQYPCGVGLHQVGCKKMSNRITIPLLHKVFCTSTRVMEMCFCCA